MPLATDFKAFTMEMPRLVKPGWKWGAKSGGSNQNAGLPQNYNHRPCRWYALAPLGPFISRAYRLIEFSFAFVWCPTTADAVRYAPKAPLCKGQISPLAGKMSAKRTKGARARQGCHRIAVTGGLSLCEQPLRAAVRRPTSPVRGGFGAREALARRG